MKQINLANGQFTVVDDEDYEKLQETVWYPAHRGNTCYAVGLHNGRLSYMHRVIMKPKKSELIDHRNRDGLDNQKANLRICTKAQNCSNSRGGNGESKMRGVWKHESGWFAGIGWKGKTHYLGLYKNPQDAAIVHDVAAQLLHGEFAVLNYPRTTC